MMAQSKHSEQFGGKPEETRLNPGKEFFTQKYLDECQGISREGAISRYECAEETSGNIAISGLGSGPSGLIASALDKFGKGEQLEKILEHIGELRLFGLVNDGEAFYEMIDEKWIAKMASKKCIKNIIKLKRSGVDLSNYHCRGTIADFSFEKLEDDEYMEGVCLLASSGIRIDSGVFVKHLSLEKGRNKVVIQSLLRLHEAGMFVNGLVAERWDPETMDGRHLDMAIKIHRAGVSGYLGYPIVDFVDDFFEDDRLFKAALAFGEAGFGSQASYLSFYDKYGYEGRIIRAKESRVEDSYSDLLKRLKAKTDDPESDLNNPDFLAGLKELVSLGVHRDGFFTAVVRNPRKIMNPTYLRMLKLFIARGIIAYYISEIIKDCSLELGSNEKFVDAVERMMKETSFHRAEFDGLFKKFSSDVWKDEEKLSLFISLANNGFELRDLFEHSHRLFRKGRGRKFFERVLALRKSIYFECANLLVIPKDLIEDDEYFNNVQILLPYMKLGQWGGGETLPVMDKELAKDKEFLIYLRDSYLQSGGSGMSLRNAAGSLRVYVAFKLGLSDYEFQKLESSINYRKDDRAKAIDKLIGLKKVIESPAVVSFLDKWIKKGSLRIVRGVNNAHNETLEERSKLIEGCSIEVLYNLVVFGKEEVFTSTFRSILYPAIMDYMDKAGYDAVKFLEMVDPERKHFHSFFEVVARYGKMNDFLGTIRNPDKVVGVVKFLVEGIGRSGDIVIDAISLSEILSSLSNMDEVLGKKLEGVLVWAYQGARGDRKILYALVASLHEYFAKSHREFFEKMNEDFSISQNKVLSNESLQNKKREIVQLFEFYNDRDGAQSYRHMLKQYGVVGKRSSKGWRVEDFNNFLILSKKRNGVKIVKYVKKPSSAFEFKETDVSIYSAMAIDGRASPTFFVHRGHSYHVGSSIRQLDKGARFVYLGSCGGSHNIKSVLEKAPDAHILATKGTGTMAVNDPLLELLDKELLKGKDIVWDDLWEKAEAEIKDGRFVAYQKPSRNRAALFLKTFEKFKEMSWHDLWPRFIRPSQP